VIQTRLFGVSTVSTPGRFRHRHGVQETLAYAVPRAVGWHHDDARVLKAPSNEEPRTGARCAAMGFCTFDTMCDTIYTHIEHISHVCHACHVCRLCHVYPHISIYVYIYIHGCLVQLGIAPLLHSAWCHSRPSVAGKTRQKMEVFGEKNIGKYGKI
jgi:hypothetical protein